VISGSSLNSGKALPAYKVIYIVTIACGRRRRQETDLCDNNFGAIPALAGFPIIPGARPQGAFNIEQRALPNVVA
jgi:hypothetical protein